MGSNNTSSALYTVTIKNLGNQQVSNVLVSHGPAPFGAVFDPAHSPGCYQSGQNVQCSQSLNAGELKTFTIVYTVDNTAHCRLAPALQSVTLSGAPQGSPITSTVRCEVKSGDALMAMPSSMSSSSSNVSSSAYSTSVGQPVTQTTDGATLADDTFKNCTGFKEDFKPTDGAKPGYKQTGYKPGYKNVGFKPYTCPPRPRTGAATEYFLAASKADFVTPMHPQTSGLGMMPVFVVSMVSILMLAVVWKVGFSH